MSVSHKLAPKEDHGSEQTKQSTAKDENKSKPKCYVCLQPWHFRAECPTLKRFGEVNLVQTLPFEDLDLASVPTAEEKRKVYQKAASKPVIIPSTLDGQLVPRVLMDTGAQQTIVNSQWVTPDKLLSETVHTEDHAHGVHGFQLAEVEIQVCGWSAVIKALQYSQTCCMMSY